MTEDEALAVYARVLKGEDVHLEAGTLNQSKLQFDEVARWAHKAQSLQVSKAHHIIGRPNRPGYVAEPGRLTVTP